jgi:hypothetical protein
MYTSNFTGKSTCGIKGRITKRNTTGIAKISKYNTFDYHEIEEKHNKKLTFDDACIEGKPCAAC